MSNVKKINVRSSLSCQKLVHIIRMTFEKYEIVVLSALERSMIIAIDATRWVCQEDSDAEVKFLATLIGIQTSYSTATDLTTGMDVPRFKVNCTLQRSHYLTRKLLVKQARLPTNEMHS